MREGHFDGSTTRLSKAIQAMNLGGVIWFRTCDPSSKEYVAYYRAVVEGMYLVRGRSRMHSSDLLALR